MKRMLPLADLQMQVRKIKKLYQVVQVIVLVEQMMELLNQQAGLGSENANQNIPGQSAPLRYPTDIAQTTQDVVKFDMLEFSPKPLTQSGGFGQGERSDASTRTLGSTILAIPGGIKDSNSTGWGDGSMNALEVALAGIALGGIQEGGEGLTNSISQTIGNVVGGSDDVKNAIAASFAGSAAGVGQQLLTRTTGAIFKSKHGVIIQRSISKTI